ncbi:MAG: hypothetical protein C0606_16020 [Hyphomicrobiales bacterium]|nr:MAG: hypothetical protein C0606_16020 [Hyphomicrobiales bacterium]
MINILAAAVIAALSGFALPQGQVVTTDEAPLVRVAKPLQGPNCPAPRSIRSPNSNIPTQVRFINELNGPVDLYWINFKGGWKKYARIRPGGSFSQQTYAGHAWIAYDVRAGGCVGNSLYFAKKDRGQWVKWHY